MDLIKKRIEVLEFFESGKGGCLYVPPTVESAYLQFRKILELIAMGSLIVNNEVYSQAHQNFEKHWNARRIVESLEQLNPDFYPQPLDEKYQGKDLVDKKDGFLTKDNFIELYRICGALLHTDNPYGTATDYEYHRGRIRDWIALITGLLSNHKIKLLDDPNLYVIHMKEKRDNQVHGYTFVPMDITPKSGTESGRNRD